MKHYLKTLTLPKGIWIPIWTIALGLAILHQLQKFDYQQKQSQTSLNKFWKTQAGIYATFSI